MPQTYLLAAQAVRSAVAARQAVLDAAAKEARAAHVAAWKTRPLAGVDASSPLFPLACLVAASVTVTGRPDDGYPVAAGPDEMDAVIRAAICAGLLPVTKSQGCLGAPLEKALVGEVTFVLGTHQGQKTLMFDPLPESAVEVDAWRAASQYRFANLPAAQL